MTKDVQQAGGPANTQRKFVGLARQITVDTSNWWLLLHDGATPGGHAFLPRDANDQRYQAKSTELDGLTNFEPSNRGFLVRLGPADYRIRQWEVDENQLKIENASGYSGNPKLAFAAEIKSDHTWSGSHRFTQKVIGSGGFEGNLEGNTKGNHTGNVVGNVEGNLTGDAHGNHTGTFKGSIDLSEGDAVFKAGSIPLAALAPDVIQFILLHSVPIGATIPFHGDIVDVPDNYWPCDGTNGTPNYSDRFVLAAGPINQQHSFGGTTKHLHGILVESGGEHLHLGSTGGVAITEAQMPKHRHLNGVVDKNDTLFNHGGAAAVPTKGNSIDGNSSNGTREGYTTETGGGQPHAHPVVIDEGGEHTHIASSMEATHMPPFYSQLWIMRIG